MIWAIFALLTGAAVFAILWPLASKARVSALTPDVAFYKAKLTEIEREAESHLLSTEEAQAARTEAARRLLRATDAMHAPKRSTSRLPVRIAAVVALTFVPALSLGLYSVLGHPNWPDDPLSARLKTPPGKLNLAAAVAKVEAHLLHHPKDGRGYEVLVPAYMELGRFGDAVHAAAMALQLLGTTPRRLTIYGETMVYAAGGVVTEAASKVFAQAAAAKPAPPKALFFLGLAAAQGGNKKQALKDWQALLAQLPKSAPMRADLVPRIAALKKSMQPQANEVAAIAALPAAKRAAVIKAMVDRLAARLAQNGHDIEGWLRLVRAYKVMNEDAKARAALASARHNFGNDPQAMARLDALARQLGLNS